MKKLSLLSIVLAFCLIAAFLVCQPVQVAATEQEEIVESTPEESTPEESVPEESVPEESIPEESVPEESIPDESIPDESIPDESVPDESIPDESVPDESVPDESIPDENEPKDETTATEGEWWENGLPAPIRAFVDAVDALFDAAYNFAKTVYHLIFFFVPLLKG